MPSYPISGLLLSSNVTFNFCKGIMTRSRLRTLGIAIGKYPTGTHNAITDVSGVRVGHTTLIYDEPSIARTGVTVILPRDESLA